MAKKRVKLKPLPKLHSTKPADLSKQTVAAVLALAIVISVLGSWLVLDTLTAATQQILFAPDSESGTVRLGVVGTAVAPLQTATTGQITLIIKK